LICIADCWVCGETNCPDNGSLRRLNSAKVTRNGKDHAIGENRSSGLASLVVQGPIRDECPKGARPIVNRVCDIALLDSGL